MKKTILLSIALVAIFASAIIYTNSSNPQKTVEKLYHRIMADSDGYLANEQFKSFPELSSHAVQKIEDEIASFDKGGGDPLLCAQDKPSKISIVPISIGEKSAKYIVLGMYTNSTTTIVLNLINEDGWHIEDISCGGTNSGDTLVLDTVGDYIKSNISSLSPVKESLGGKFFITSISFNEDKGIANYEDGHNAFSATFRHSVDSNGKVIISDFKIIDPSSKISGTTFTKTGNLVKYENKENWSIVYEEPGKPALNKELLFGDESLCIKGQEVVYCEVFVLTPGDRVKVEGVSENGKVQVLRMTAQ